MIQTQFNLKEFNILKNNVIFTGGFSECLQGYKSNYKDLDVITNDLEGLKEIGKIYKNPKADYIDWGYPCERYFIVYGKQIIDIWYTKEPINYIEVSGCKCQPIEDIIKNKEYVLQNNILLPLDMREKIENNLKRLKEYDKLCNRRKV